MHRRAWLSLFASMALTGCKSMPGYVKGDSPETKTARLPKDQPKDEPKSDIVLASEKKEEPTTYRVKFETTAGDFVVEVHRDWAPLGAQRFHDLVAEGFYDGCKFFRVLPGFMVQWGVNGDPEVMSKWRERKLADDPPRRSNKKGFITFATAGPNTRTTQVFINYKPNMPLDNQGFVPFGSVIEGMEVVESIQSLYGERPDQGQIQRRGNEYLEREFPKLDGIKKAYFVTEEESASRVSSR